MAIFLGLSVFSILLIEMFGFFNNEPNSEMVTVQIGKNKKATPKGVAFQCYFRIDYKPNKTSSGVFPPNIKLTGFSKYSFTVFKNPTESLPSIIL